MTSPKSYILIFAVVILWTSFTHKDLNEYGKWLKFYDLKDEDFQWDGNEVKIDLSWKSYDLDAENKKFYDSLCFYSLDSTHFLDLYSYSVLLEKGESSQLTWGAGDPESKVQLVKTKDLYASMLLYFGTQEFSETAIWRNNSRFEIFGFTINNEIYIPTIWKFDLYRMTKQVYKSKKTFKTRPKSYLIEVRLKAIKQR